jgi:hypothetical protein
VPEPCASDRPALLETTSAEHVAACHFAAQMAEVTPESLRAADGS